MFRVRGFRAAAVAAVLVIVPAVSAFAQSSQYDALIARHAAANGVPESLVRRVIMRESRYNHRAVSKGNYGLMQIRLGTARGLGYRGTAAGLLDPDTNMTYAVRYLAGAYRAAGGNHDRAVAYYQSGYYGKGQSARVPRRARAVEGFSTFFGLLPDERGKRSANRRNQEFLTSRSGPAR
jgi:soluble lytic murein transglycosylase-like protein